MLKPLTATPFRKFLATATSGLLTAFFAGLPAHAQELAKAEEGLGNFLTFFQGNMGNIIVAFAIIAAVFMILARRASFGMAAGIVVLAMILANAKELADQLDAWF